MTIFKRSVMAAIALSFVMSLSSTCFAADNTFKRIYENSLYGGLAGSLVGAAFIAFTETPSDHVDYVIYGAASGVLVGAAYGMVLTTKSLAEVDNGKVTFAIPTIIPRWQETDSKGQYTLAFNAVLIRGTF